MKIIANQLIYETWLLRNTNNRYVNSEMNYLIIQDENTIKFKSIDSNYLIGVKKSRTAEYKILNRVNNTYAITFRYLKKNTYTYSILGIEIPEIKTKSEDYKNDKNLTLSLYNNVLLVMDNDHSNYYVFDLFLGKLKYLHTETQIYTFLFTQIIGIVMAILLNRIIGILH